MKHSKVWGNCAAVVFTLLISTSCSRAVPSESAMLAQTNFDLSVQGQVNSALIQSPRAIDNDPDASAIDALLRAGIVSYSPDTRAEPWFSVSIVNGQSSGFNLVFPIGKRKIVGTQDQRSWQNGPVQYYAETIEYNVAVDPRFNLSSTTFGPYSIRVVLANDPAIGNWKIDAQSDLQSLSTDYQSAMTAIFSSGNPNHLRTQLAQISQTALNQIRDAMTQQLGLRRDGDGEVRLISQNRFFFVPTQELRDGATFSEARRTCQALSIGKRRWHLAGVGEINPLFFNRGDRSYFDTANFSIWGPAVDATINLVVDDVGGTSGVPESETISVRPYYIIHFETDGSARLEARWANDYRFTVGQVMVAWVSNDGRTRTKVLCASNA